MNIQNIVSIDNIIITPLNPFFFMSSIEKSFEILSKHNRYGFVPGSFALIDTFLQH